MAKEYGPLPKTEGEIQALLDLIPEEAADDAGVFISYLVNEVYPYDEIELRTGKPIGQLGTRNSRKRWVIIGEVGDDAGCDMKGGELLVGGNAGAFVGTGREGGEIHLCGDYENISGEGKGTVYHKGKLIA